MALDDDDRHYGRRPKQRGRGWLYVLLAVLLLAIGVAAGYLVLGEPPARPQAEAVAVAQPAAEAVQAPVAETPQTPVAAPSVPAPTATTPAVPAGDAVAAPEPAAPGVVKVATIGDWVLACPPGTERGTSCLLQQQLRSTETKAPVFLWVLSRDADGTVHAIWQMPAGANPQGGLTMDIGDGKPRKVPFSGCNERLCMVQATIATDYLQSLQQAQQVLATVVVASNGRPAQFGLSARGMAEGLARLVPAP